VTLEVERQGLELAGQVLHHTGVMLQCFFCVVFYSDRVSCFLPGQASDQDGSQVARITGMWHHTQSLITLYLFPRLVEMFKVFLFQTEEKQTDERERK
jgi:hypothetical protein